MKVTILQHDGGELGNQLWNYASVYAYALERGYECENLSFFEYAQYFRKPKKESVLFRLLCLPFRNYHDRRSAPRRKFFRKLYKALIVKPALLLWGSRNIFSSNTAAPDLRYDLPPSAPPTPELSRLEKTGKPFFLSYVSGGFFRNPLGLMRYRAEIRERFAPSSQVAGRVAEILSALRKTYPNLIGVHIRQGDYRTFKGGKYWVAQSRVREILEEYMREKNLSAAETCFLMTSDGPIERECFTGLNLYLSGENVGVDLFLLAGCDAIIGSNSTFGYFAAYLGNIPHIVLKNEPMDWTHYAGKKEFFENKYLSVMTY